jgi:hypothetical protein
MTTRRLSSLLFAAATVDSESDRTGQSTEISGYFGFDIGFDARGYRYPPD